MTTAFTAKANPNAASRLERVLVLIKVSISRNHRAQLQLSLKTQQLPARVDSPLGFVRPRPLRAADLKMSK